MDISSKEKSSDQRGASSAWRPLRHPVFRAIWLANFASNIGTWIQNTAAAWLMTSLATSPLMVSLVATASNLPAFLLCFPAGALADVIDRRRLIIFTQSWMLIAAAILGLATLAGLITPWILLGLTLALGIGSAFNMPAWQAIQPELVPKEEIAPAVALNGASMNAALSIGPALGGLIVGQIGSGEAFLLNAASFLMVILVVFFWKREPLASGLPSEHIWGAIKAGARYLRYAPELHPILTRTVSFVGCAFALPSLLPLLAKHQLELNSTGFGILLGCYGAGSVIGTVLLPKLKEILSINLLCLLCQALFALALSLLGLGLVNHIAWVCTLLVLSGACWLVLLSILSGSVQVVTPSWVRGRAMAGYLLTFYGGMAGGSLLWGTMASAHGVPATFLTAAGCLLASAIATSFHRIQSLESPDLTISRYWHSEPLTIEPRYEDGPVLITIEYFIEPQQEQEFLHSMSQLRLSRLKNGALRWNLFVDGIEKHCYVESFVVDSWLDHLRQHERTSMADLAVDRAVRSFHRGSEPPQVRHYLGKSPTIRATPAQAHPLLRRIR